MTKKIMLYVSMLFLAANSAFAASLQDLQVKDLERSHSAAIKVISDETLMTVTYVGASTECQVGLTSSAFTTYAPGGTADLSIDMTAAAYDTLGELCDYIEADADYTCKLTGGKRDDASYLLGPITASSSTDAKAAGGYSVLVSTGGNVKTDPYILTLGITPAQDKAVVLKHCIGNFNVADHLTVYGKLQKYVTATDGVTRNDTTKVYSKVTTDDTDLTVGNIYSGADWLEFAKNEHVVIRSIDGDNTQAAANFIECVWSEK